MLHINLDTESYYFRSYITETTGESILEKKININKNLLSIENDILFSIVTEDFTWKEIDERLFPALYKLIDNLSEKNVYWIINNVVIGQYDFKNIKNILYIDFFALKTYYKIFLNNLQYNTKWNSESNLGLFLPGKLTKTHRIGILYSLYKKDLLKKCLYSAHLININSEILKNIILKIDKDTNINFDDFFLKCDNTLDEIELAVKNVFSTTGFPYDVNLYQKTCISIVSETHWGFSNMLFSEKIYRTIANKHPFILVAPTGMIQTLNNMGFITFENYMYHKDYNTNNICEYDKLNQISENLEYFLNNFSNHKNNINLDVEHNFSMFLNFCNNEINRIFNFINISNNKDKIILKLLHEMDVQNYTPEAF